MTETSRERCDRIRAEQDRVETMMEEVRARVSPQEWQALTAFNTYCANRLDLTLDFYRAADSKAYYRFRASTREEVQERAEQWVEDNL